MTLQHEEQLQNIEFECTNKRMKAEDVYSKQEP